MGRLVFSRSTYEESRASRGLESDKDVTRKGEQQVKKTGKLSPLVDPAIDALRRSMLRLDATEDGRWEVTVGCPMDIETSVDSTGSMGDNVDRAMAALPRTYELCSAMLPGYDPQLALGFFGDVCDDFVLNRPQFEMEADKIVGYLSEMNPERNGGDCPEDPQYSMFASAYLTSAFTNKIGLKGYYFMCTDAPMHARISPDTLERIFGKGVWDALHENGYDFTRQDYPDVREVVRELSAKRHAFVLSIGVDSEYDNYFGSRVIPLRSTDYLPEFESAIIGITEGVLEPDEVEKYLAEKGVPAKDIKLALNELLALPFGAQRELEQKNNVYIPKLGDIFEKKTDIKPIAKSGDSAPSGEPRSEDTAWL